MKSLYERALIKQRQEVEASEHRLFAELNEITALSRSILESLPGTPEREAKRQAILEHNAKIKEIMAEFNREATKSLLPMLERSLKNDKK